MKIGQLDMHCGNCAVVDYCGNPFCYAICCDERFEDMDDKEYHRIAESSNQSITKIAECDGCTHVDQCECLEVTGRSCEHNDEQRDHYCHQIASFVAHTFSNRIIF